ncbi:MAG: homoserine kinase [Candidatus Aminicenantes bacterium]|nr:MAG: homoserine kinase [Candidatus Aminicenantes bacterium]
MKPEIIVQPPATIANFGPGFDMFALALEGPSNVLKIRPARRGDIVIRINGGHPDLPTKPEENTAGLAALHFFQMTGADGGADIEIDIRMPTCAGLGSSAASAVAAVFGLDKLYRTGLAPHDIIELASLGEAASGGTPHADNVAACALGGFVFVRSTRPLRVEKYQVPPIPVVVRVRQKDQKTTRGLIPAEFSLSRMKEQMAGCAAVIHAVLKGDIEDIGASINRDHISEPVRSRSIPGYDDLKRKVLETGAFGCNVCGGGSSVFAICAEEHLATVAEVMRNFPDPDGAGSEVFITRASNEGVKEIHGL